MADPRLLQAANQLRQTEQMKEREINDLRHQIDSRKQDVQNRTNQVQQEANRQTQQLQQELQQAINQINNDIRTREAELNSLRHQRQDMETQANNEKILPR